MGKIIKNMTDEWGINLTCDSCKSLIELDNPSDFEYIEIVDWRDGNYDELHYICPACGESRNASKLSVPSWIKKKVEK
jgi:hypothetical protein